ncbi:MAG TPA: methylene-tetrahydromethanopterin dehydrogenase N-terminal domain-containing protein [Candidatus Bathyarchaeia archaeon]|nr:methylene-tetrahydromethanopterin dehydrogenase N-terminal domain-containing protein [Candidatus Bathyarchaeia archaeon]
METLELKPLAKKKLNVLIVEKEYNEPFQLTEPTHNPLSALFKPSIGFYKFLEAVAGKVHLDYATEELGIRSQKEFYETNVSAEVFQKAKIPFFPVDIDENAKNYLATAIDRKVELRNGALKTLDALSKQGAKDESMEKEYLIAYGQGLQAEIEEQEGEVNFSVRESWMAMGIMTHASEIEGKEEITCLHISSPNHVAGIKQLLEPLNVKVEVAKLSKKVISATAEVPSAPEVENWLQSIQVQVKPVIGKSGENPPSLLFYLDTDPKASPFDICMAYDAGYNAVIPYENVTAEDSKTVALDALLSRGPKGAKNTVFMIGGKNAEKAEEVLEAIKNAMFPPFKGNIIIDPAGAYTTAAAMVAKTENALLSNKLGELKDKTCAIMGTGAVGQIAAVLLAKMGCNVMIASLNPKRVDGKEHAEGIAKLLAKDHGVQVQGIFAPTAASKIEIIKKADIIMCAGVRGVRIIEKEMLNEVKHMKVLLDINAVPPLGIEGIELKDDMREMMPGIFTIGALAVGELKHKLEKEILREARTPGKDVYNYNVALPMARKLLEKDLLSAKMILTLSYPASKGSK